jgi:soluble lytic murein transglycosylase-like protein
MGLYPVLAGQTAAPAQDTPSSTGSVQGGTIRAAGAFGRAAAAARESTTTGSLQALARRIAVQEGVPPNLFQALVEAESSFQPNSVSSAGAMGLSQLMPGTAQSLGVSNPFNPTQNLEGGARYLAEMLAQFHSVPLALAAYNAGPGAVEFYHGVPPYPQTQAYVQKVMALAGMTS